MALVKEIGVCGTMKSCRIEHDAIYKKPYHVACFINGDQFLKCRDFKTLAGAEKFVKNWLDSVTK